MKRAMIIAASVLSLVLLSMIAYAIGSPPKVALFITDTNQAFDIAVEGHKIKANYGEAENPDVIPDVIIRMSSQTFVDIYSADDFKKQAVEEYRKGNMQVEIVADYSTLALKGYKAIFDSFAGVLKEAGESI